MGGTIISYRLEVKDGKREKGYIDDGDFKLLCIDKSQCSKLYTNYSSYLGLPYYWDGTTNYWEHYTSKLFGNCSMTNNDIVLVIYATSGGGGFKYTLRVDEQEIENHIA